MKAIGTVLLTILFIYPALGQGLEMVPPVLISKLYHQIDSAASFILTPANVLEIVDAAQPWPPRWFATNGYQKATGWDSVKVYYENGRVQNGLLSVYRNWSAKQLVMGSTHEEGYIVCNEMMEAIDTIRGVDVPIDPHDLRINEKGEKLILAKLDTVLNVSSLSGNPKDTAQLALVDVIEILDSNGHLLFRWNGAAGLGVNAEYFRYAGLQSRISRPGYADWSHANSIDWDFDGNILYGFKNIGVGKISRIDGHVIWRMDRNKMPYGYGTGTIAFYLQHAFDKVSDSALYTTYSLFSNGDSLHRFSYALLFRVNKQTGEIQLVKKKKPVIPVVSRTGGNYEIEPNGDYILCYGNDINDAGKTKIFFEYGNAGDELYATYRSASSGINTYNVHQVPEFKPPRPTIIKKGKRLKAEGEMKEWIWYQMSGPGNAVVQEVGEGAEFKPKTSGTYCVMGKYGIGWSVSLPVLY